MENLSFCFKIGVPTRKELHQWGDYHFAKSFGEALRKMGHRYSIQILPEWNTDRDVDADVVIHLRGLSKYVIKRHHFNVMWNISHPSAINMEEYEKYDVVLVASNHYADVLREKVKVPVYPLLQFVDPSLFYYDYDSGLISKLLFVGNSRGVKRKIIEDLGSNMNELTIYGSGWKGFVTERNIKGTYFKNEELRKLYSSCDLLLNDHWQDMKDFGFINNRVFDAYACKTILISDEHDELKKLFPESLTYHSQNNLNDLIHDIYNNKEKYKKQAEDLYVRTMNLHTVNHRANQFIDILSNFEVKKNIKKEVAHRSLKVVINEALLTRLGYGKTYRLIHKLYQRTMRIRSGFVGIRQNKAEILKKLTNTAGIDTLINVTTENEVKALASSVARYYRLDEKPFVSIIIPTKDGLHHLKKLIPFLKTNTLYPNYEVIVIDNSSKDPTKKFIEQQGPSFKYINSNSDLNFSQSINLGFKYTRGDLIVLMNNDVVPLYGWLDEMLFAYYDDKTIAIVGSRLIYNQHEKIIKNGENIYPGCSIQHDGIRFIPSNKQLIPYNSGKYENPLKLINGQVIEEVPAVTAACMLVDRQTFQEVNGFNEEYSFGKEDIDFCLKAIEIGKRIVINKHSLLIHREFSTQKKRSKLSRKYGRIRNSEIFNNRWFAKLSSEIWDEKINSKEFYWTENRLKIAFLVTENHPNTTAGDFFSAQGLGEALRISYGYDVCYLPRRPHYDWSAIPISTDISICMRHDFDIRKSSFSSHTLKVAWIRGYISEWINSPWIHEYDAFIFSTQSALDFSKERLESQKIWGVVPLGVTSDFIKPRSEVSRDIDVSFVGNIFEVPRDIVTNLDLEQTFFNFHFYGKLQATANHPWSSVHKGTVPHDHVPEIYSRSKIVIEDTAPFNKETINLRVFEAAACGALVISNKTTGLYEMFDGNVLIYRDKEHLTQLIRYYLENETERKSKAEAAREQVLKNHTFQEIAKLFKNLLDINLIFNGLESRDAENNK